MSEIEIVKKDKLQMGASKPGIIREVAFRSENISFCSRDDGQQAARRDLQVGTVMRNVKFSVVWFLVVCSNAVMKES